MATRDILEKAILALGRGAALLKRFQADPVASTGSPSPVDGGAAAVSPGTVAAVRASSSSAVEPVDPHPTASSSPVASTSPDACTRKRDLGGSGQVQQGMRGPTASAGKIDRLRDDQATAIIMGFHFGMNVGERGTNVGRRRGDGATGVGAQVGRPAKDLAIIALAVFKVHARGPFHSGGQRGLGS